MVSQWIFTLLVVAVAFERLAELVVSKRSQDWSLRQGGKEFGQTHYPLMVAIHTGLLISMIVEVWFYDRPFIPQLGFAMLLMAFLCQGLRWWVINTLGPLWNTRVIVVPGAHRVTGGPFQYLTHPNYLAVVVEGIALPLIHTAWVTALWFTLANAIVLWLRIRVENKALTLLQT